MLDKLNRTMQRLPRALIVAIAIIVLGLLGAIDHMSGYEISLSIFYLGPIALSTWYVGARSGYVIALIGSATWIGVDLSSGHVYSNQAIPFWDGLVHLGIFAIVVHLLSTLRAHLEIEKRLARTDFLTGIPNRLTFMEQLSRSLDLAARARAPLTLAYIDVDDFKHINDTDGHDEGDSVLRLIASTLGASMRRTDVVARLGGDEFAVLLPNTNLAGAQSMLGKAKESLRVALRSGASGVNCSIGAVTFIDLPQSVEEAVKAADALMYEVKRHGKNAVRCSTFGRPVPSNT